MFGKDKEPSRKKGRGPIFNLFRVCLSLAMISLLLGSLYLALKNFSGIDPLKIDSEVSLKSLLKSDRLYSLVTTLLTLNPKDSLDKVKQITSSSLKSSQETEVSSPKPSSNSPKLYRFGVVSDSHNDSMYLQKALQQIEEAGAEFVIGLGDYTDVGSIDELENSKEHFDSLKIPYYVTAGDHDLWESRAKKLPATQYFTQVFGFANTSFTHKNTKIIIIYDSDNYLGVDEAQFKWIETELDRAKLENPQLTLVFASIPLFHPSSDHIMGKSDPNLKSSAAKLISLFKQFGVAQVIAGDAHFFSSYTEPNFGIRMTTVGAVTSSRNLQAPRFALIDVFEDGSYNIQDTEIK